MGERVVILTIAYNAEQTIERAIKSILGQTYTNWVYYLFDNGSTDKTRSLIKKYASSDERIIATGRDENDIWSFFYEYPKVIAEVNDNAWFCSLDADDEYTATAFADMILFCETYKLDVVFGGSNFIDSKTRRIIGRRIWNDNVVIEEIRFSDLFGLYHQFARTIWAKLFRVSVVRRLDFDMSKYRSMGYGGDTYFIFELLNFVNRFGIIGTVVYNYYVSSKSSSYVWNPKRIASDNILFGQAESFLISKTGAVSPRNDEFLLLVYMEALHDTLRVLLNAQLPQSEKIDGLCDMFLCSHAKRLAARENLGAHLGDVAKLTARRKELYATAAHWLLSLKEISDEQAENYCKLVEYLCAVSENVNGWVFIKKRFVRYLIETGRIDEARPKIDEMLEMFPNDAELLMARRRLGQKS
jgi:glycosyltransferase involved in cell wall biosynthesis